MGALVGAPNKQVQGLAPGEMELEEGKQPSSNKNYPNGNLNINICSRGGPRRGDKGKNTPKYG